MEELVWQVVDSGLPTGGFAHSFGLEAASRTGHVLGSSRETAAALKRARPGNEEVPATCATPLSLRSFIMAQMESVASQELPFVFGAHRNDELGWEELDRLLFVRMHPNQCATEASIAQGSAFIRVALGGLPLSDEGREQLERMRSAILGNKSQGMYAVVFGRVLALLGMTCETAQKMYIFLCLRDMISAAKRLSLVGPMASVKLQADLACEIDSLLNSKSNRHLCDASQTFPLGDILHSNHSHLFRRLFVS